MKKVLITGASSGIGLQLCHDYLKEGFQVIACGRNKEKLARSLKHPNVEFCVFDITNQQQVSTALEKINLPDLFVLSAGDCQYIDDAKHLKSTIIENMIQVNFMGIVYCIEAILPRLNSGAHIAVVSSSVTYLPLTRSEAYGASKAALDYFSLSLAVDLHQHGITMSLIRPGFVDTPLTRKNTFPMPGMISTEMASKKIRRGIEKQQLVIDFPWYFIAVMRLIALLPGKLKHLLAVKMVQTT